MWLAHPLTQFLIGLHMLIDGWRPVRDEEGWSLRHTEVEVSRDSDEEGDDDGLNPLGKALHLDQVKALPRLLPYLKLMMELTAAEDPLLRRVRAKSKFNIIHSYGDASGNGFGWCIDFGDGVRYELGKWCERIQEATSNYRELKNLVNDMVRAAQEGRLEGCKVFLYTDNHTSEVAYCKGTANIRALFELIIVLYKLQIDIDSILHVIWIAGTRMIQQGTDGLSRGERTDWLLVGCIWEEWCHCI
jgi:hypothetical protein